MNINFNDATFEKLRFLADREGRSVAAFVSMRMDELAGQLVNTTFTVNEIPDGVQLAHLDPTPRPAPTVADRDFVDYSRLNQRSDNSRRYSEEQQY